jgi:hypothetical protein
MSTFRPPKDFRINVDVTATGTFIYTLADGTPADSLRVVAGDTVSWCVRLVGSLIPFQIQFPNNGPFGFDRRSLRSPAGWTDPMKVVKQNLKIPGCEYTVTLANGWHDDPDIVPVPEDGTFDAMEYDQVAVTVAYRSLAVDPDHLPSKEGKTIRWLWKDAQDKIRLTFVNPPDDWPPHIDSIREGDNQAIYGNLTQYGSEVQYKIATLTVSLGPAVGFVSVGARSATEN